MVSVSDSGGAIMLSNFDWQIISKERQVDTTGWRHMKIAARCAAAVLFLAVSGVQASASILVFSGADVGVGPGGSHPISTSAATSFNTAAAALGTVSVITFEAAPLGT